MPTLSWNDALSLDMPELDVLHHDFVKQVGELEDALARGTYADVTEALDRLVAQTAEHFALEERWMASLSVAHDTGHVYQHQAVLNVLHEVQRLYAAERDRDLIRRLVAGLGLWFPAHTQAMDTTLVRALDDHRRRLRAPAPAKWPDDGSEGPVTSPGALAA